MAVVAGEASEADSDAEAAPVTLFASRKYSLHLLFHL